MSCRIRYGVFTVVDTNSLKMDAYIFFEVSESHLYQTVRYNDTEDRIFEILPCTLVLLFVLLGCSGSGHLVSCSLKTLSFAFLNPSLQFVELWMEDVPCLINC
jgi:hypothetical protein